MSALRRAAEQPYSVEFTEAPGIFVKSMHVKERFTYIPQHAHTTAHLTMVAKGEVLLWKDGAFAGRYTAPAGIHIEARVKHLFMTWVDDCLLYCIHRVDGEEGPEIAAEHQLLEAIGGEAAA